MLVTIFFTVFVLPAPVRRRRAGTELFPEPPKVPPGYEGKTRIFDSRIDAEVYQAVLQDELRNGLHPLVDGEPDFSIDPADFCAAMAPAYLAGDDFIE